MEAVQTNCCNYCTDIIFDKFLFARKQVDFLAYPKMFVDCLFYLPVLKNNFYNWYMEFVQCINLQPLL